MMSNGVVQSAHRFTDRFADRLLADLLTDLMSYVNLQRFPMVFHDFQWCCTICWQTADRFADGLLTDLLTDCWQIWWFISMGLQWFSMVFYDVQCFFYHLLTDCWQTQWFFHDFQWFCTICWQICWQRCWHIADRFADRFDDRFDDLYDFEIVL